LGSSEGTGRANRAIPPLRKLSDGHLVACHWAEEIKAGRIQPQEREAVFAEQPAAMGEGPPPA
jgi:peptide/nickel transport system ATP-binding protein